MGALLFCVTINAKNVVNMEKSLKKISDLFNAVILLGLVFFIPLIFGYFFRLDDGFELVKTALFKILVLLLFVSTLTRICLRKKIGGFNFPRYLFLPIIYLVYVFLLSFFSHNFNISYVGAYSRFQGLETQFFYVLFFFLLLFNIREKAQIKRIVWTVFLSATLVGIYGLVQISGFDPIIWSDPMSRIISTIGQPDFLASYLLLVLPLGAYLLIIEKKFLLRFFISIGILIQIFALYFTYSFSGFLGFVGGLALLIFLLFKNYPESKLFFRAHLKKIFSFAGVLILVLILMLAKDRFLASKISFLKDGSPSSRLNTWKAAVSAIEKNPIFGYGLDTQQNVLVNYYKKDWALYENPGSVSDRAHDLFLDSLLTTGLIGFILYFVWVFYVFRALFQNIKNDKEKEFNLFLLSGLVGYFISILFGFAVFETNFYFWLFSAFIIIINIDFEIGRKMDAPPAEKEKNSKFYLGISAVVLATLSFYRMGGIKNELIANFYLLEAKRAYAAGYFFKSFEFYYYTKELGVNDHYLNKTYVEIYSGLPNDQDGRLYEKPVGEIFKGVLKNDTFGNNIYDLITKAEILQTLSYENKEDAKLAEVDYKKAIALSPEFPNTYYALGNFYFKMNDLGLAEKNFLKAVQCLPDPTDPRINLDHKAAIKGLEHLIFKKLGDIEMKKKNYGEACDYYKLALDDNLGDLLLYKQIADTYYLEHNYKEAIFYNKKGMARNPEDSAWPLAISILYKESGNFKLAEKYGEIALSLDPRNKGIKSFLENLSISKRKTQNAKP